MALTCKNCGGNVGFSKDALAYICDYCGTVVSIGDTDDKKILIGEREFNIETAETYKRAKNIMIIGASDNMLMLAARLFEQINGFLDSEALAKDCRFKAEALKTERIYRESINDMNSNNSEKIKAAHNNLVALGDYKEAKINAERCVELYSGALKKEKEILIGKQKEEKERQRLAKKAKYKRRRILLIILIIAVLCMGIGYFHNKSVYSADNVSILFEPNLDCYCEDYGEKSVFYYTAIIKNNGEKDIELIECSVFFINDKNETIVNTSATFSGNPIAVRSGNISKYSWQLSVYSDLVAQELYNTSFKDFKVEIVINTIYFSDGEVVEYT